MSAKTAVKDRRVERTQRALQDALVELILEQGWDAVSVQQVCDRANVGRSTFYTHFADKEELLIGGLDDLRRGIRRTLPPEAAQRPLGFARGIIEHADERRRLFRAVIGKRSGHVVQQRFRQMLLDLVHEDLRELGVAPPELEVATRFLTGALMETLIWWVDTRNSLLSRDVESLFSTLAKPVLSALSQKK